MHGRFSSISAIPSPSRTVTLQYLQFVVRRARSLGNLVLVSFSLCNFNYDLFPVHIPIYSYIHSSTFNVYVYISFFSPFFYLYLNLNCSPFSKFFNTTMPTLLPGQLPVWRAFDMPPIQRLRVSSPPAPTPPSIDVDVESDERSCQLAYERYPPMA